MSPRSVAAYQSCGSHVPHSWYAIALAFPLWLGAGFCFSFWQGMGAPPWAPSPSPPFSQYQFQNGIMHHFMAPIAHGHLVHAVHRLCVPWRSDFPHPNRCTMCALCAHHTSGVAPKKEYHEGVPRRSTTKEYNEGVPRRR